MIISLPFAHHKTILKKAEIAAGIVWLFQISAIIGIFLGFQDWFIEKTPLNLLVQFSLLIWVFPIKRAKNFFLFLFLFSSGMLLEWLGVQYGFLFGNYSYGGNLGMKFQEVPLLIGCNWAILVFVTSSIANKFLNSIFLKSLLGASLMVLLDIPLELIAPSCDFWAFEGGTTPWNNYVSWFGIAFFMHYIVQKLELKGNFLFSLHLFISQLLFFAFLTLFF